MFKRYHFTENARIITLKVPGPQSKKLLRKQEKYESKNRSYPRLIPIAFDKARGATVTDEDGNTFLDFFSGCGVFNLGHNNPDILKKLGFFEDNIIQAVDFPTKTKINFMEKLFSVLPKKMRGNYKINFGGPTGSDAVEAAIKLARIKTGKNVILSFQGSYHGMTTGALSVTSKLFHRNPAPPLIPGIHFMPYCSPYRCPMGTNESGKCKFECINYFQNSLENPHSGIDKPAALILEPIQGEGGTYIPKDGWVEKIVSIARKNHILVIFDEIQTGFYRTGKLFAFEHTDAIPDIITMSKGIGGIGFPLSLILYKKELDIWKPGTHIGTFRGNQIAMRAGILAIKMVKDLKIEAHVKKIGKLMKDKLKELQNEFNFIGEVRSEGMIFGVEYVKNRQSKEPSEEIAKKILRQCYENGLIVELGGYYNNVIRFLPPLIITRSMALNGLVIFKKANENIKNKISA